MILAQRALSSVNPKVILKLSSDEIFLTIPSTTFSVVKILVRRFVWFTFTHYRKGEQILPGFIFLNSETLSPKLELDYTSKVAVMPALVWAA